MTCVLSNKSSIITPREYKATRLLKSLEVLLKDSKENNAKSLDELKFNSKAKAPIGVLIN